MEVSSIFLIKTFISLQIDESYHVSKSFQILRQYFEKSKNLTPNVDTIKFKYTYKYNSNILPGFRTVVIDANKATKQFECFTYCVKLISIVQSLSNDVKELIF